MQEQQQRPLALLAEDVDPVAAELVALSPAPPRREPARSAHPTSTALRWGQSPKRLTKSRAFSATSRQPWSIVSEWPRLGISTCSVTPGLWLCFLKAALLIAGGTAWSSSPVKIKSGPRSGFLVSALVSAPGLKLANAAWKIGLPGAATWNSS